MTGKKNNNSRWIVLGCVVLVMCAVIAGVVFLLGGGELLPPEQTGSAGTQHSGTQAQTAGGESVPEDRTESVPQGETLTTGETAPVQTTRPNQSNQPTSAAPRPTDPQIQAPVTIPQQKEAAYEQWLAAGMIIGISMEYPDFELQGIYLTGETTMENKMDSDGAYILFTSGGRRMAVHSSPLASERKIPGTVDLSAQSIGYATFDTVDAASVNTGAMTAVPIGELEELIAQSMLVSLYWN